MKTKYIVNNQSGQTINEEVITRPYKVYTALLTQSGGSNPLSTISGPLTIGVTYNISQLNGQDDFTNVGAPINDIDVIFVATGTTPNNWSGESILLYDEGVPTAKVLENTIGNIYFTYGNVGTYTAIVPITAENKQVVFSNSFAQNDGSTQSYIKIENNSVDGVIYFVTSDGSTRVDGLMVDFPIEIRVYN